MANPVKFSFKGIIATAFAPFKGSETEINLSVIDDYAKHYAENNFKAVLVNGTYGEGMAMTTDERIQVANAWQKASRNYGHQIIVQVGGTQLQDVKKLAAHAQSINVNAILCLPELYYKPKTVEDLIDYLAEVGACAPKVPLFYYHSPDVTGVTLSMAEFFQKVENKIPTLAGIKFANANVNALTQAIDASAGRFSIIVASNSIIPASIALGIDTFMPTVINVAPELVHKIYNLAISGDILGAQTHQRNLLKILNKLSTIDTNIQTVMKAVTRRILQNNDGQTCRSFDIGTVRKPLRCYDSLVEESDITSAIANDLKSM